MAAVILQDEPDYSVFDNKTGLAEDMKFLASMPELCDVTFLVGETREPVCAVKAVLGARSKYDLIHITKLYHFGNKLRNSNIFFFINFLF